MSLSSADIAAMRVCVEGSFADAVAIQSATIQRSPAGHRTEDWETVATVMGRRTSRTGREAPLAGQTLSDSDWVFWLPAGTAVVTGQRLLFLGGVYAVESVESGGEDALEVKVWARRIEEGTVS